MKEIMTYAWDLIKRFGFSMSDNRKYNADIQTYFIRRMSMALFQESEIIKC